MACFMYSSRIICCIVWEFIAIAIFQGQIVRAKVDKDNKCIFLEGSKSDLVCGEDNITYSTMCHLVKNGTQYAYSGPCSLACTRRVCGEDGIMYASVCHAMAADSGISHFGTCRDVKTCKKCHFKAKKPKACPLLKCTQKVLPPRSACEICGSQVIVTDLVNSTDKHKDFGDLTIMTNYLAGLLDENTLKHCHLTLKLAYPHVVAYFVTGDLHNSRECENGSQRLQSHIATNRAPLAGKTAAFIGLENLDGNQGLGLPDFGFGDVKDKALDKYNDAARDFDDQLKNWERNAASNTIEKATILIVAILSTVLL